MRRSHACSSGPGGSSSRSKTRCTECPRSSRRRITESKDREAEAVDARTLRGEGLWLVDLSLASFLVGEAHREHDRELAEDVQLDLDRPAGGPERELAVPASEQRSDREVNASLPLLLRRP